MNDVDTDKRRCTLAAEERPRTSHPDECDLDTDKIELTRITRILPVMFAGRGSRSASGRLITRRRCCEATAVSM